MMGEKKNVIGSVPVCHVSEWPNQVRRRNSAIDNFISIPTLGEFCKCILCYLHKVSTELLFYECMCVCVCG